mgnify:CR=1 FL=1
MAHGNGRIYSDASTGVSLLGDIREFFGLPYNGIYDLIPEAIDQDLINKWAKYKPIHYPGKLPLEDADFRGRSVDTNDHGLVYGLKVPAQVSVIDPAAFHATSWDYLGYPNAPGLSGSSLYRARDFDGYSANALPDIYGLIPSGSKFYIGTDDAGIVTANSVVNEGYRTNNQYGVPLARYVVDGITLTDNQLMSRLAQCYPAILIGNYLTAVGVYNSGTGNVDYGTIVRANGGGWVVASDSWCVDMRKLDDGGNRPWTADTNTVATLVLVYTASSHPYLIHNDSSTDFSTQWINLYGRESDPWTSRIFPLPGACGVSIQVERYITPGYNLTPVSASGTTSQVTITFDVTYVGSGAIPTGTATVSARVGGGGTEPTTTVLLPRAASSTVTVTFSAADFDKMVFNPSTDTSIFVHAIASPGADTYGTLTIQY